MTVRRERTKAEGRLSESTPEAARPREAAPADPLRSSNQARLALLGHRDGAMPSLAIAGDGTSWLDHGFRPWLTAALTPSPPSVASPAAASRRDAAREAAAATDGAAAFARPAALAGLRLHDDATAHSEAAARRARAFTRGDDIYFARGALAPSTAAGRGLVAHEVGHALRQRREGTTRIELDPATDPSTPLSVDTALAVITDALTRSLAPGSDPFWTLLENEKVLEGQFNTWATDVLGVDTSTVDTVFNTLVSFVMVSPTADIELAGGDPELVDFQTALDLVSAQLGSASLGDFGLPISYGTADFQEYIASELATAVVAQATAVHDAYNAYKAARSTDPMEEALLAATNLQANSTLESLKTSLSVATTTWGDPFGLLELELGATIQALERLRGEFKAARDETARAELGKQIGFLARKVRVLDVHLAPLSERLRRRDQGDRVQAIGETDWGNVPAIASDVRETAKTETSTLELLDEGRTELRGKGQEVDESHMLFQGKSSTSTSQEEAYPETTDAVVLAGQRDLAAHLEAEVADLKKQHDALVPKSVSDIVTFGLVYYRWHGFWSRESRDNDPAYQFIDRLYKLVMPLAAMGGPSGWLGRGFLTQMVGNIIPVGDTDAASFEAEVGQRVHLTRFEKTTGDLLGSGDKPDIKYETANLAPSSGHGLGIDAEQRGREATASNLRTHAQNIFTTAYQQPGYLETLTELHARDRYRGRDVAATRLLSGDPTKTAGFTTQWSYLLFTEVLNPSTFEFEPRFEHKLMRTEVARHLMARTQYYKGARDPHFLRDENQAAIGDEAAAGKGLKEGNATSAQRYLKGEPDTNTNPEAESFKSRIAAAKRAIDSYGGNALVRDLEKSLDTFFQAADPASKVLANILIGVHQNDLSEALISAFNAEAIAWAIGFSVGVAVILLIVSMLGEIGYLIAYALRKVLAKVGLSTDIATVITIGQWGLMAGSATSFSEAQRWAYIGRDTAAELSEMLRDFGLAQARRAVGGMGKWAWRKTTGSKGKDAGRDLKDLFGDKGLGKDLSWEVEQGLRSKLEKGERGILDKQTLDFLKAADPDAYSRLKKDFPDAFKDALDPHVKSMNPTLKAGGPGAEMQLLVVRDLPDELASRVRVVEVDGDSVRIKPKDGMLVVEVGKKVPRDAAGTAILSGHVPSLKRLAKYTGPLGRVRFWLAKVGARVGFLTGASRGGIADAEVTKLKEIQAELEDLRTRSEKKLDAWSKDPDKVTDADLDAEIKNIEDQIAKHELELGKTGIGKGWIAAEGKGNWKDLDALGILNKPLDAAGKVELEKLGYRIDKNGVVYRPAGAGESMEALTTRRGVLEISEYETAEALQARITVGLDATQIGKLKTAQAGGGKVFLVEGVHDTGATWKDILGGPTKATKRAELKQILLKGGLTSDKADELINGLVARGDTVKVVFGTDPVRDAVNYRTRAQTGSDEIAHHFDPLYLGGGHNLIANLPKFPVGGVDIHDEVHRFFNNLTLPNKPGVSPAGSSLQPQKLQNAVPAGSARPAIVTERNGEISYEIL